MRFAIYSTLAVSCFVMTAQAQEERVIGLNFIRLSSGAGLMTSTDVAGVFPAANWNTATADNAHAETVGLELVFDNGEESGALATWQTGIHSWSVATNGAGSDGGNGKHRRRSHSDCVGWSRGSFLDVDDGSGGDGHEVLGSNLVCEVSNNG